MMVKQGEAADAINEYIKQFGIDMPENAREIIEDYAQKSWELGKLSGELNTGKVTDRKAIEWFTRTQKFDFGKVFGDYEQEMFELVQSELEGHVGKRDAVLAKAVATKLNDKMTEEKILNRYGLVMANATNKARNYSRVLEYEKLDFYELEIVAIIDQKTSKICKELNGRRIEVKVAASYVREVMSTDPNEVVSKFPWPKEKNIPYGASTQEILDKMPCKLPPYHGHCRTSALVSLRGTSIKEAAKYIKDLGIKDVLFADTKDLNIINNVIDGLVSAKNKDMPMPESLIFSNQIMRNIYHDEVNRIPGAFIEPVKSPTKKTTLLINKNSDYWEKQRDESLFDYWRKDCSTDRMDHLVLHEIAHLETFNKGTEKKYHEKSIQEKIGNEVSGMAGRNNIEFLAEMRVGLLHGLKYSDDIMKEYENYGGIQ